VTIGRCLISEGATGSYLKFQNNFYQFNQSWGPMLGFWMVLVGIVWTLLTEVALLIYSYRLLKDPTASYSSIK
jgi:hypothetical protein